MKNEQIELAKADIEATEDLLERALKLSGLGLDAPSRRSERTADRRLRAAFGGERAPSFS